MTCVRVLLPALPSELRGQSVPGVTLGPTRAPCFAHGKHSGADRREGVTTRDWGSAHTRTVT